MRKADYFALARIIREQVRQCRATDAPGVLVLRAVAAGFADCASVDGPAFLRACGFNPVTLDVLPLD